MLFFSLSIAVGYTAVSVTTASAVSDEDNYEIVFWDTVKESKDPKLYQMYLDKYPGGAFSDLAEILKAKYSAGTPAKASSSPPPAPPREPIQAKPPAPTPAELKLPPAPAANKSYYKVAIFPFKFYDDADYMKSILLNDLMRFADRYDCLEYSHSYYQLDSKYNVIDLHNRNIIDQSRMKARNLWKGNSPNTDQISELGRELGFDTVITGSLRVSNPWSDRYTLGYIRIHMVDVASGRIIRTFNRSTTGDARDYLPFVVQRAMDNYTGDFCR